MDERRSSAGPAVVVVLAALLLPIVYLLSLGPAAWLIHNGYIDNASAELFYAPVIVAADNSMWIRSCLEWYMEMFI